MDSESEIASLKAIIALRQQEEKRLQAMITDDSTSAEVRIQAQTKLGGLLRDIKVDVEELTKLEADQ
jgi:hypothetical protein